MADADTTLRTHRDCIKALDALESCLDVETASVEWAGRVGPCVDRLGTALRRHFAQEERGEFYVELPTRKPRLASRIEAYRAEHRELLSSVDGVASGLEHAADENERRRLAARAASLVDHIRRHEASESELMQSAALREVGAGD